MRLNAASGVASTAAVAHEAVCPVGATVGPACAVGLEVWKA
jgi:hypothetical protein